MQRQSGLRAMAMGVLAVMVVVSASGWAANEGCDGCYAIIKVTGAARQWHGHSEEDGVSLNGYYVCGRMYGFGDHLAPAPQYYWVADENAEIETVPQSVIAESDWRSIRRVVYQSPGSDAHETCNRANGVAWLLGLSSGEMYFRWYPTAEEAGLVPPTTGWLRYPPPTCSDAPEDFQLEFICAGCETPILSGAPETIVQVEVGESYSFTPGVALGAPYRFECLDCPGWLTCDPADGTIYGTPEVSDIGIHDIRILMQARNGCVGELDSFIIEVVEKQDEPSDEGESEEDPPKEDGEEDEDFPGYDFEFEFEWSGDDEDPWDPDTGLDPEFSNITWLTRFWVYVMRGVPDLRVWPPLFCWPPPDALLDALIEISSLPAVFGDLTVAFNDIETLNLLLGLQLSGAGPENALVTILDTSTGDAQRMYCLAPDDEVDLFRVFLDRNAHALLSVPEVVLQGEEIRLEFALTGLLTGSRVHDPTANLALVRHEDAGGFAFVSWNLIGFDEATQRYFHSIDTSTLAPGTYDLYVGTSQDWMSRRIRIEIEGP